jgi:hypothetical protein
MEYLLREKLEKLVQSEIESRLAAYQRDGVALSGTADVSHSAGVGGGSGGSTHASMVSTLEDEVRSLRRRLQQSQANMPAAGGSASDAAVAAAVAAATAAAISEGRDPTTVQQLRDRLSVHVKERRAIHTIMEQKIKTLVDTIATAAASVQAPQSSGGSSAHIGGQISREVQALQRLVNASIAALRNSELEQQQEGSTSLPGVPAGASAAAVATPLARATERGNTNFSAVAPSLPSGFASTPASIDAMIQRRKDELARMRSGSEASSASFAGSSSAGRPLSAVHGR